MTALTAAELGVPERFNAAAHFVDRHLAEGRSDKVAIECGAERVTYAQLAERVNRCGNGLRTLCGIQPGERILLLLLDGPAFFYAFFGAIKMGAVPIPTNTLWKPADYRHVINDSGARVAIVSEELAPRIRSMSASEIPGLARMVVAGAARPESSHDVAFDELLGAGSPSLDAVDVRHDAPAFWLYSSGSTGAPKGCVHLQRDMVVCAELFAKGVLGIREDDRCFSVAKLFFAYGLGNGGYFPLAVGATSILWPGPPSPASVYRVIAEHRPTLFYSVPTGYGMMLAEAPGERDFDLSSIRLAVSAGEALPPSLYHRFKRRFGVDIIDGIGSTEVLHMFISNRPAAIRPGSSGLIVDGYEAAILDDEKRPVPQGEIGNLWIKGDSICDCYWNQSEKTAATIQNGWIRTGDKYSQDADAFYWYAGRSDDMLKVGGQWVSPIELENALLEHTAVQECGVAGRADRDGLLKPMAFVVLRAGTAPTAELAEELQAFARSRLAEYKRPRWVSFLDELPKTATGKLQRFKLRAMGEGHAGAANISS
jgi:benzoate-CoA ligase family protein